MASTINASNTGFGGIVQTGDSSGQMQLQTAGTTAVTLDTSQNATFAGKITSAGALTLASNGSTTAITIDTSQNVGIGTTSPQSSLDINAGSSGVPTYTGTVRIGSHPAQSLASKGGLEFLATNYSSGYGWRLCGIDLGGGSVPFVFQTRQNSASWTETMRIDSSGNVLIGTTTGDAHLRVDTNLNALTGVRLVDSGTTTGNYIIFTNSAGNNAGTINHNGTTTVAYNTSSDYRLKENIVPMTGALDKVAQLKPVTYTWKNTDNELGEGFIAHELAEVCPLAVTGEKDAVDTEGKPIYQGVDTSFLVATLTAAIQEQQTIIKDLKARIETLENK